MSKPRTHLLRVKPPWREDGDRTRCGRRVADEPPPNRAGWARATSCIPPDDELAARARQAVREKYRPFSQQTAVRDPPAGLCAVCWENLGTFGNGKWRGNPLAVLRVDLAVTDDAGRVMLGKELIAPRRSRGRPPGRVPPPPGRRGHDGRARRADIRMTSLCGHRWAMRYWTRCKRDQLEG